MDCKPYNYNNSSVPFNESYLYNWLNNDFYNKVFNEKEKEVIINNEVLTYDIGNMKKYCDLINLNKMVIATFGTEYARGVDNSSFIKNNDEVAYKLSSVLMYEDNDWFKDNNYYFVTDNNFLAGEIQPNGEYYEDKEDDSLGIGIRFKPYEVRIYCEKYEAIDVSYEADAFDDEFVCMFQEQNLIEHLIHTNSSLGLSKELADRTIEFLEEKLITKEEYQPWVDEWNGLAVDMHNGKEL